MSPAEPTANPGEPDRERIASPPSGPAEPAAGWRPREPPLIIVNPAFVLDRWRPTDSAAPAMDEFLDRPRTSEGK